MAVERALSIIKPDAVAKGAIGKILARFEQAGLNISHRIMLYLFDEQVGGPFNLPQDCRCR